MEKNEVFYDANIWIGYLIPTDSNHSKSVELFEVMRAGDYVVRINRIMMMEVIHALRKKVIKSKNKSMGEKISTANKKVQFFFIILTQPSKKWTWRI